MIHSFTFRNFCSFEDETALSFVVGEQAPDTHAFFPGAHGRRLSKVMAVLGANASGKTNLLKAYAFLCWFVRESFGETEAYVPPLFESFAFTKDPSPDSEFAIEFEAEGALYRYRVRLDTKCVIEETFEWRPPEKVKFRYLLKRTLTSKERERYDIKTQDPNVPDQVVTGLARPNCSLVSALLHTGHGRTRHLAQLDREFRQVVCNVTFVGRRPISFSHFMHLDLTKRFKSNKGLMQDVACLLSPYDLGLAGLTLGEVRLAMDGQTEPRTFDVPLVIHNVDGAEYGHALPFESSGTQNMCRLLANCLPILHDGGMAVLDEFEADLHPRMVPELVNLFLNPGTNPGNAQLLFSCHATSVLQELDKTQVYLVEKDERCRSHGWRLDEVQGVRRDDNLYAKYMAGAYGAVPNL
jgi:hypothetical protein